jgi:hypothetical protein
MYLDFWCNSIPGFLKITAQVYDKKVLLSFLRSLFHLVVYLGQNRMKMKLWENKGFIGRFKEHCLWCTILSVILFSTIIRIKESSLWIESTFAQSSNLNSLFLLIRISVALLFHHLRSIFLTKNLCWKFWLISILTNKGEHFIINFQV